MPRYTTKCTVCGKTQQQRFTYAEYDLLTEGGMALPCECKEGNLQLEFNPGDVGFILKDSPVGGWQSKAIKESKYRARRAEVMAKREKDHVFKSQLVPNYKGQEGTSWKEVQDHVRAEKGDVSASTYEPLVTKESKK